MKFGKIAATSFLIASFVSFHSFAVQEPVESKTQFGVPALARSDFNSIALEEGVPLYWYQDKDADGLISPDEFYTLGDVAIPKYVKGTAFTKTFEKAYKKLVESKRRTLVRRELLQGRPALIVSDLSKFSKKDKEFVRHIMKAGQIIDELYQIQKGGYVYKKGIPGDDAASRSVYERNQGVWCEAYLTESSQFCNAHPDFPVKKSDAYPQDLKHDAEMCEMLKKQPNAQELLSPFTVVRRTKDGFKAVPLTEVYGKRMKKVASELRKASDAIDAEKEKALGDYLLAAAKGFETNEWEEADEAWAKMSPDNSRWYLRVAPDEVYFDPCGAKAGFELSFALVSKGSKVWQERLDPLKSKMENEFAELVGPSYKARQVKFRMPEFIDIVLNAGDSRHNLGAVVGQSLPNWGKIAEEGRGRTVAMTNFYTDPDSLEFHNKRARLLFHPYTLKHFDESRDISLITTVLHEATHNLGPYPSYKVHGKRPEEIFGGRTASVLEELKAQTGAVWYPMFLYKKRLISKDVLLKVYVSSIYYCFNRTSMGIFTADGKPKAYGYLSLIQLGTFLEDGALKRVRYTDPETKKKDWRFWIDFPKLYKSAEKLMGKVGKILATGDAKAAEELMKYYVSGKGSRIVPIAEITKRYKSYPKASFYYKVELD